jgi:hypothetical protein
MKTFLEEVAAPCETGCCTPPTLSDNERKNYTGTSGRNEEGEERKKRMKDLEDRGLLIYIYF